MYPATASLDRPTDFKLEEHGQQAKEQNRERIAEGSPSAAGTNGTTEPLASRVVAPVKLVQIQEAFQSAAGCIQIVRNNIMEPRDSLSKREARAGEFELASGSRKTESPFKSDVRDRLGADENVDTLISQAGVPVGFRAVTLGVDTDEDRLDKDIGTARLSAIGPASGGGDTPPREAQSSQKKQKIVTMHPDETFGPYTPPKQDRGYAPRSTKPRQMKNFHSQRARLGASQVGSKRASVQNEVHQFMLVQGLSKELAQSIKQEIAKCRDATLKSTDLDVTTKSFQQLSTSAYGVPFVNQFNHKKQATAE